METKRLPSTPTLLRTLTTVIPTIAAIVAVGFGVTLNLPRIFSMGKNSPEPPKAKAPVEPKKAKAPIKPSKKETVEASQPFVMLFESSIERGMNTQVPDDLRDDFTETK